jgi:hypothetical protein
MSDMQQPDPGSEVPRKGRIRGLVSAISWLVVATIFLGANILIVRGFARGLPEGGGLMVTFGIIHELTFIIAPVIAIVGVAYSLVAVYGLVRALRSPGRAGLRESIVSLLLTLPLAPMGVLTFLVWGSGFEQ